MSAAITTTGTAGDGVKHDPTFGAHRVLLGITGGHPALATQGRDGFATHIGAHLVRLADDVGQLPTVALVKPDVSPLLNPLLHLRIGHAPIVGGAGRSAVARYRGKVRNPRKPVTGHEPVADEAMGDEAMGDDVRADEPVTDDPDAVELATGDPDAVEPATDERVGDETVGVGPWEGPLPSDDHFDPDLLAGGDRRNVADRYRYWTNDAIVADLDLTRHPFHVAIENWVHDRNIGTVVRTANAFNAAGVHIVGKRRWNRRGAMVTDRYQHLHHHPDIDDLVRWATAAGLPVVGIDNLPGSVALESASLPAACVLLFGQEGPGLSAPAQAACTQVLSIAQFGSTRSINAGVAAGIAMHVWIGQHASIQHAGIQPADIQPDGTEHDAPAT